MHRKRTALIPTPLLAFLLLAGGLFAATPGAAQAPADPAPATQAAANPGATGAGFEDGIPFWVWRALPQVFPEYVPGAGGYLSFGFEWNRGEQLPVGLAMTDDRIPLIRSESGPGGVGGTPPDLQAYREFLVSAARDPRFTADNILPIIQYNVRLSLIEKLRYRYLVIPRAREALLQLGEG